jgi:glycosyltransferase involved in cell wall biosynthesis
LKIWLFNYDEIISKGTNPRLLGYYEYLKKHGHQPCFCFLKGSHKQNSDYNYNRVNRKASLVLLNVLIYCIKILSHKPIHTAYFYGPNAIFIPIYLACQIRGVRVVIEKVELDSTKEVATIKDIINWSLYQLDEWFAPRLSNALIVISSRLALHYQRWNKKTSIVSAFTPYHSLDKPVSHGDSHASFTIGYLGSFANKDDIETLISAHEYVSKQLPDAQLKLIGNLPSRYGHLTLYKNVICIENVASEDIHSHLLTCDVLIAIRKNTEYSHYGFPSKLTEYLATGIPTIVTPTSDIPELFNDGEHVVFIPHGDYQALGEAILAVSRDKERFDKMGSNAYQWSNANWHPDKVLKPWIDAVSPSN